MVRQVHEALTYAITGHIEGMTHTILPLREVEDIIRGKNYMDVIGEKGATYYLRRKFRPETIPNWGVNNPGIMEAFYHKKSIKQQGTIMSVKCGEEWIADRT